MTGPDGKRYVSAGATAAWIDKLELSEERKRRLLAQEIKERDACRAADSTGSLFAVPSLGTPAS